MGSWVLAVDSDDLEMFKTAVTDNNINTYVTIASGDEYTPVLYVARLSPQKSFKEMMMHCMDLNADLSLKAKTIDCRGMMGSTRCTTIGNLASWRESKGWNGDPMGVYDILVKMDNGEPNLFVSNMANTNAMKWKKTVFLPCMTWKPGCGVPGIGVGSSLRRSARLLGKAVVAAPVAAVGAAAGTAAAAGAVGSLAVSRIAKSPVGPAYLGYQVGQVGQVGKMSGGRKSYRKSRGRSRSRKSRKSRR
jgi:hypothetical protein